MASLNLSSESRSIQRSHENVLNASLASGASRHHCVWAIFSVSAPLINVFQGSGAVKDSVLKVQNSGEGDFHELAEEFSDGRVQFAFVKLRDPGSTLPKLILISWCGDGVPERTKGYFTSFQASVEKALHGYNIQITCRSEQDLDAEQILQKVSLASGSKYSNHSNSQDVQPEPRKSSEPQPKITPFMPTPRSLSSQTKGNLTVGDDGWGPDAPPVTRSSLEKVESAYKPTRVDMPSILSSATTPTRNVIDSRKLNKAGEEVVKGGYQPIGKVDIAALRRAAGASSDARDEKPTPVRGSYEPVGRVDIAEIRAKARPAVSGSTSTSLTQTEDPAPQRQPLSGRLDVMPKPKITNKFNGGSQFAASSAQMPLEFGQHASSTPHSTVGRTFAMSAGKTPAQLWAEKHNKTDSIIPDSTPPHSQTTAPNSIPQRPQIAGSVTSRVEALGASFDQAHISETQIDNTTTVNDMPDKVSPDLLSSQDLGNTLPVTGDEKATEIGAETNFVVADPTPKITEPATETTEHAQMVQTSNVDTDLNPEVPTGRVSVEAIEDSSNLPEPSLVRPKEHNNEAVALYDYTIDEDNELALTEGETITNIDMIDADWWHGTNSKGQTGLFPSNHVRLIEEQPSKPIESESHSIAVGADTSVTAPSVATRGGENRNAIALYDYDAAEDNELSFTEGAVITDIEFPDEDWWQGRCNGREGLFPANHVKLSDG